jgi:hypothetical protein
MRPYFVRVVVAALAVALACGPVTSPVPPILVLAPVLDSMFVGDSLAALKVTLYNSDLVSVPPGTVIWSITPTTVATINASTGTIHGVGKGAALVSATASNAGAGAVLHEALIIVSRRLDMTLLMDTVYVMPTDTFTLPLAIQDKGNAPRTVWFNRSPNTLVYSIDTTRGLVTAGPNTGTGIYIAHAATSTDTVVDTGAVVVLTLTDTTGHGHMFQTVIGTAIRHQGGPALALNFLKLNGHLGFVFADSAFPADTSSFDRLNITLPDSVIATETVNIDSISPQEAVTSLSTLNARCRPPRPWAYWQEASPLPGVVAYSHGAGTDSVAGAISVTQYVAAAGGGAIISGRFAFRAQRVDLYYDTLGVLAIQGTFVAPLVTRSSACQP